MQSVIIVPKMKEKGSTLVGREKKKGEGVEGRKKGQCLTDTSCACKAAALVWAQNIAHNVNTS